jgi:hypothetical protein
LENHAEGEKVEIDELWLEVRVDDVCDPQHHYRADDDFRILGKCGHRERSSSGATKMRWEKLGR